jgi:hypothetical protein
MMAIRWILMDAVMHVEQMHHAQALLQHASKELLQNAAARSGHVQLMETAPATAPALRTSVEQVVRISFAIPVSQWLQAVVTAWFKAKSNAMTVIR